MVSLNQGIKKSQNVYYISGTKFEYFVFLLIEIHVEMTNQWFGVWDNTLVYSLHRKFQIVKDVFISTLKSITIHKQIKRAIEKDLWEEM